MCTMSKHNSRCWRDCVAPNGQGSTHRTNIPWTEIKKYTNIFLKSKVSTGETCNEENKTEMSGVSLDWGA